MEFDLEPKCRLYSGECDIGIGECGVEGGDMEQGEYNQPINRRY